uniref:ribosomal protein L22 n=1 Tax=Pleurozia acinosa TaxID=3063155 RepID=UPI00286BD80D|nr:ribosomal protein L22 [Pleurozia acinosa]WKR35014.1 ribosomal protein L22 [Pleurozia acinosa]
METTISNKKIKVLARHIRMSSHKIRRVVNPIRGRSYEQALMILEFMPYRACDPILQLLSSAAANANNNFGINKTDLFIKIIQVDGGPFLKRFRPRAQGHAYPIHKPTCHITIVMGVK